MLNSLTKETGSASNYNISDYKNMKDKETNAREQKNIFLPAEDTNSPLYTPSTTQHMTGLILPCSTVTSSTMPGSSQQEAATHDSHDINRTQ